MQPNYTLVDENTSLFPGDYIMYTEDGKVVGSGALVKRCINTVYPLTKSYYILKNLNTGKTWRVNTMKYEFFVQSHKTQSVSLMDLPEIREIKEKYLL